MSEPAKTEEAAAMPDPVQAVDAAPEVSSPTPAAPPAAAAPEPAESEQAFDVARILADPALIFTAHHTLVGAFHDAGVQPTDLLTRPQVAELVEKYESRPVNEEA